MAGRFLELFLGKQTLLDDARNETTLMITTDRRMFDLVLMAVHEDIHDHLRSRIAAMDKEVNEKQREVRRKVFAHLSISRGNDLLQGLELITAVIDLERVGDYTKNIAELVEMVPGVLNFGEQQAAFDKVEALVIEIFNLTTDAFVRSDIDAARKAMSRYNQLSMICDKTLENIVGELKDTDSLEKRKVVLVLLLRYFKRVGAHLKNIATILVNPFHRIGYRSA
ncbi:MAG: PhoU domain-containing protein [Pseudomonadota bacterium]